MKLKTIRLMFLFAVPIAFAAIGAGENSSSSHFNVREFGAAGDGVTLDTKAIQRAVDQCSIRGGVVLFTPGKYLTGSVELKSNVELHLQSGAIILGSTRLSDYFERVPKLHSYNDVYLKHSLFYAEGQSRIAITGRGVIDGQGGRFPVIANEKPARYLNRPFLFRFVECRNITVEGVTLQNSAMWMQHYLACDGLTIRGITVMNHANKNNDMMDIDGCRNVVISDCTGDTDDDAITLKSTSERITENVVISNCVVSSHCNAIKTGTESTGGFRNIAISNMVVKPSAVTTNFYGKPAGIGGIVLTQVDGGIMDGVTISNAVIDGPEVPIFVRLGNRARKHWDGAPKPGVGTLKNVAISNVLARNAGTTGCPITGLPDHPVEGLSLNNIRIDFRGAVKSPPLHWPGEMEDQYPEATMFGTLPSYGFAVRHVRGFQARDLTLTCDSQETRPVLRLDDVVDARIEHLDAPVFADAALVLERVIGLALIGSTMRGTSKVLYKLIGDRNARISAVGNDARGIRSICEPADAIGRAVFPSNNQTAK